MFRPVAGAERRGVRARSESARAGRGRPRCGCGCAALPSAQGAPCPCTGRRGSVMQIATRLRLCGPPAIPRCAGGRWPDRGSWSRGHCDGDPRPGLPADHGRPADYEVHTDLPPRPMRSPVRRVQQLANLRRTSGRPRVRVADRAFWLLLSRLCSRWADVLVIVKPDTVVQVGGLHHRYERRTA
jgi:hypothetical protein